MENAGDKDRRNESCGLHSSASEFFFLPKIVDVEFLSLANKSPASFKSEFILVLQKKKKSVHMCVSICSLKHGENMNGCTEWLPVVVSENWNRGEQEGHGLPRWR